MIPDFPITAGIVYHIWLTGQHTAALTRYRSTIMAIVECGALITYTAYNDSLSSLSSMPLSFQAWVIQEITTIPP
jgi:hypothetical protein